MKKKIQHFSRSIGDYLSRILRTDANYLLRGSFWLTFEKVSSSVLAIFSSVLLANFFNKNEYGDYKYIFILGSLFDIAGLRGASQTISRAASRNEDGILQKITSLQIRWASLSLVLAIIFSIYYLLHGNYTLGLSLFFLGINRPFFLAFRNYQQYLIGKKIFKTFFLWSLLDAIFSLVLLLSSLFLTKNVIVIIGITAFGSLLTSYYFYSKTKKYFVLNENTASGFLKESFHFSFLEVINIIAGQIDKLVLYNFYGSEALAIYAIAQAFPTQAYVLMKSITATFIPKLTNRTRLEIVKSFNIRIIQALSFGGFVTLAYILLAPSVIRIFFPKYIDAIFYSQILSLDLCLAIAVGYIGAIVVSQKMIRENYLFSISGNFIRIALCLVFGFFGGVKAILFAVLFSRFTATIYQIITCKARITKST